jgi:hypothetical protein
MFGETARLVDGISTFGNLPLVVVAAGKPNPSFGEGAEEYRRYWIEQSRALTAKSARGRFVLAGESSHYLYFVFYPSDTGAMPQKIPGAGAELLGCRPDSRPYSTQANSSGALS